MLTVSLLHSASERKSKHKLTGVLLKNTETTLTERKFEKGRKD